MLLLSWLEFAGFPQADRASGTDLLDDQPQRLASPCSGIISMFTARASRQLLG